LEIGATRSHHLTAVVGADHVVGGLAGAGGGYEACGTVIEHEAAVGDGGPAGGDGDGGGEVRVEVQVEVGVGFGAPLPLRWRSEIYLAGQNLGSLTIRWLFILVSKNRLVYGPDSV
jgi:hypothetical protein